jgi:hypothetical protein
LALPENLKLFVEALGIELEFEATAPITTTSVSY